MVEIMLYQGIFIVIATLVIFHGFKLICIMEHHHSWRKTSVLLIISALAFLGYAVLVDFKLPTRDLYLMLIALVTGILLWHKTDRRALP